MEETLSKSHKYKLWMNRLRSNGLIINNIKELYTRRNQQGEVLFSLVHTDADTPEGHKIPPLCFIKGEVVCVLVCLIDKATHLKYLLLVQQRRICDGSLTFEHPAGMLDSAHDAAAVAAREVYEETGIEVEKEALIQLKQNPCFPSTGTSDEAMYFFYFEKMMTLQQIMSYDSKNQGLASEHENITTKVIPFEEAHQLITNTNGILHNFLYLKAVADWELLKTL